MRGIFRPGWMLLLCSLFAIAGPVSAQECTEYPTNCVPGGNSFVGLGEIRDPATANSFSLSPPGARSLAMGGAFLGLADDATAAYTNPAGLTNLAVGGAEVAVELRRAQFSSPFVDGGHFNTQANIEPDLTFVGQDFIDGLQVGKAEGETSGLSFLSYGFVLPGGLTGALYRHQLGNFQSGFESQGPFNDDNCDEPAQRDCELFRVNPSRSSIDMEVVNWGASAAYAFDVSEASSLSVGLGVSYYEAEMERRAETFDLCRFDVFDPNEPLDPVSGPPAEPFDCTANMVRSRGPGGFYGPADFGPDNSLAIITEVANDDAFGFNLGFLWKIGREQRFSVGGVFRKGPKFNTVQKTNFLDPIDGEDDVTDGTLTVPDVFGLGVAYRSAEGNAKFTFDWNRVFYSQTLGDFTRNLGVDCDVDVDPCPAGEIVEDFSKSFTLDDIDQFHFGFEAIVLVVESLVVGTVRLGAWLEPDHTPQYVGENGDLEALFGSQRDDELHLSLGFGLVVKEDFQLDFAASFSDTTDTQSFSLVTFF